jgi:hypothetical protein
MTMDVGWRFDSARLSRTDKGWRYVGRVHEYLAGPGGHGSPTLRVPATVIKFKVTDEDRRSQQEYTILRILQEETAEKPFDTRASFYLARTYNVVKNHTASLAEFNRRVSLGGWREEVYESLYAIAYQKKALGAPWHEVQQAFLDAHAHSPERAEPLYAVASHWHRAKVSSLAYLFASHAATLSYPTSASLWVQADVYAWQCWFIMGMTGLDVKKDRDGARALLKALTKRPADHAMQQQLVRYRLQLGAEVLEQIECDVDRSKCKPGLTSASDTTTTTPTVPGHVSASERELRVKPTIPDPGASDRPLVDTAGVPANTATNLPALYALLAFLLVTNLALLVALRKGKAVAACMPQGIMAPDNLKQV